MDKVTEIIPDNIPQWAQDAIDAGQLWQVVFARIKELEAQIDELELQLSNVDATDADIARYEAQLKPGDA